MHSDSKEAIFEWLKNYGKGAVLDYIRRTGDFKERAYLVSVLYVMARRPLAICRAC
jgi:hypothetical protein